MMDAADEGLAEGWRRDVGQAIAVQDWARAVRLAERALALGLEHPQFLQLRAAARSQAGRHAEARADLERAHRLDPSDLGVVNALGLCLMQLGESSAARAVLERGAAAAPDVPVTWANIGRARLESGDPAGAEAAYARAAALDPGLADVWGRLAAIAANRGDPAAARERAARALALDPHSPDGRRALIEADLDQGDPVAAERGARAWLSSGQIGPNGRSHALGLLGDALEAQRREAEAFAAYTAAKAEFGARLSPAYAGLVARPLTAVFADLARDVAAIPAERWVAPPPAEPGPATRHVFLMGFMRSGTTLLEQALSRHPDVVALEETEALAEAGADRLIEPRGLERIADAGPAERARWRAAYWAAVAAAGVDARGRVLVDKLPFNGVKLPLIATLFPEARIVFALRDPRDVVLSCFQRRLQPNAYSYEMRTLDGAARLYAGYMALCAAYRAVLPLTLMEHRHEALVADVGGEVARVCDFIGIDYRPQMTAVEASARSGRVLSQSARQLGQGLNAAGLARWRRYAGPMAAVAGTLQPWVRAFGYPEA